MFFKFVIRRVLFSIPTIVGIVTVAFLLGKLIPGDPAVAALGLDLDGASTVSQEELERVRTELGLDRPVIVQYMSWFGDALQGDLGRSSVNRESVTALILRAFPNTMFLLLTTISTAALIGISLGVFSALHRGKSADLVARLVTIIGVSTPPFWLALVLILVFAFNLNLFPMNGSVAEHGWIALVLPTASIALQPAALIARMSRSSMLEVLSQDMIRTATAKGLSRWRIILRHGLPNALSPVITVIGFQFANLMGGAVAIEVLFGMPGLGSLLINAIFENDLKVIQGVVVIVGITFAVTNLAVDLLYSVIDPRIKL
ncbi:ABC transporter permease [Roseibium sp. SCP14]|uniref:ABC transporter permease n=1 Tax=Roseibium sp. SCP14 TaxID=3141375 RepID=UPI00333CEA52